MDLSWLEELLARTSKNIIEGLRENRFEESHSERLEQPVNRHNVNSTVQNARGAEFKGSELGNFEEKENSNSESDFQEDINYSGAEVYNEEIEKSGETDNQSVQRSLQFSGAERKKNSRKVENRSPKINVRRLWSKELRDTIKKSRKAVRNVSDSLQEIKGGVKRPSETVLAKTFRQNKPAVIAVNKKEQPGDEYCGLNDGKTSILRRARCVCRSGSAGRIRFSMESGSLLLGNLVVSGSEGKIVKRVITGRVIDRGKINKKKTVWKKYRE